jgi:hypothetical protein
MKTLTLAVISSGSRKAAAYHSVSNTVSSVNSVSSWVTRATDCLETRTVEAAELSGALSPPIRFDRLSTPSSSTDPEHVAILPASAERRVVFPPPEGPMMATRSPGEAWPLIPWRMRLGAPPTGTSTLKSENTTSIALGFVCVTSLLARWREVLQLSTSHKGWSVEVQLRSAGSASRAVDDEAARTSRHDPSVLKAVWSGCGAIGS